MPSLKLIAGFAALLALFALLAVVRHQGYAEAEAKGAARYNALVAQHATTVAAAVEDARHQAEAQAASLRAAELELARKDEARAVARAATLATQLRALKDAADADPELARCLALPLPDGLRRDAPAAGPGGSTG